MVADGMVGLIIIVAIVIISVFCVLSVDGVPGIVLTALHRITGDLWENCPIHLHLYHFYSVFHQ